MLKLDFWNIVLTIINLIILYLLMKKFLFGPIMAILEKRQNMIESSIADANQKQDDAGKLKQQYEDMLSGAHAESMDILEKSKKTAKAEYENRIQVADARAQKIVIDAQNRIQIEREKAIRDMQSEIAGIALTAARKVVGSADTDEINQSLYDQFLAEAGDMDDTDGE